MATNDTAPPAPTRRRLSLGPALIAALVLTALVPSLLVSWLLSSNSSQAIDTLAENAMSQAAYRVDVGALAHLGESHTVVNALVPPFATSGAEGQRTRNWLNDTAAFELMAHALTQQSPNVPYLYFGTADGSFFGLEREDGRFIVREIRPGDSGRRHFQISEPGDRSKLVKTETTVYDPRKRPWYQLAASTGQRVFTDVYRSAVKSQFDLTLAQPIFDTDGKSLLGVIAVDMSLARLTDLISNTKVSDNAVTYLVDGQGRMVASSVKEELSLLVNGKHQRITPLQSSDPLVRESFAQLSAQKRVEGSAQGGLVRLETQQDWLQRLGLTNNRLMALQRPFGSKYQLDWQLIVVAPEQDFTQHVTQARQWALLAMAALIGIGVIVAYAVAQGLSRQFQHLNRSATLVGTGKVPAVQQNAAFREVHLLSEVMHNSAVQLRDYNQEIQQKNTALQEAAQMLEERVRLRTAELAASREEALAAVKAKAGFLAVMSHEIRTPLNGVVGMSELLGDTGLTDAQKDLLGVLKVSSEQLLSVVDDILDFSKIESGKLALEHLPLDLKGTIASVCDIVRLKSQEKGLPLKVHIAPDVPPAMTGDITRLRQVLLNLLSNAIKFTDHGTVALRVWVERKGDPMVLGFSVSDTGIGISANRLGDLFQPFSQGDTSTARVYGGTGLGLMICRHLVELMGGEIMVSSQVGVGSTFRFTIQANTAHLQDVVPLKAPALPAAQHLQRVLVVDDNPVNLKVASAMLTRLGYPHDTLDNGLRAIEAVEQAQRELRPYALLLLDSHMPDIDGVSTAKQIHERLGAQAPVIIGVSASSLAQDRVRCMEAGMADYLVKPLELQMLAQALLQWTSTGVGLAPEDGAAEHTDSAQPMRQSTRWVDPSRLATMAAFDDARGSLRQGIVDDFLATLDERVSAVKRATQTQDFESLFAAAHLLKGACDNIGATPLSDLCAAFELAASKQTLPDAGIEALIAAAAATRRSLEETARRIAG